MTEASNGAVLRVIDVNLNRLREALRVIEEYTRFMRLDPHWAGRLKGARHSLTALESCYGRAALAAHRDTETDPFAHDTRPEEMNRTRIEDILVANFKRAQEAARVLEEYAKVTDSPECSGQAKHIRFELYASEKEIMEGLSNG